jgi:hypothetical protein
MAEAAHGGRRRGLGGGARSSHFHLPAQMLLGLLFLATGSLLLLKYFGKDYLPFLPEPLLVII